MPFYPFLGKGSPAKIDYRQRGTLILTSLLEDLGDLSSPQKTRGRSQGWHRGLRGSRERLPGDALRRSARAMWAAKYGPPFLEVFMQKQHGNQALGDFAEVTHFLRHT